VAKFSNKPPFDSPRIPQYSGAGKFHGSGLPANYGRKYGGFTDTPLLKKNNPKGAPPRKMN
jgi:hypothetical protein